MDIDLGPACNIASYRDLEWFEDIPAGDCVLAGIPFAIRDAIVLMHGYVEDKRSRFYPDLPECVVVEVGQKATALAFLHTARFQFNAFRWNNNEAIAGEYRISLWINDGTESCFDRVIITATGSNTDGDGGRRR